MPVFLVRPEYRQKKEPTEVGGTLCRQGNGRLYTQGEAGNLISIESIKGFYCPSLLIIYIRFFFFLFFLKKSQFFFKNR